LPAVVALLVLRRRLFTDFKERWMFISRVHQSRLSLCVLLFLLSVQQVLADVRLPRLIGDGMVLQRDVTVALWGWADAGEVIKVLLDGTEVAVATAGADGKWRANLPARPAGDPATIVLRGKNTITLKNVLFGEVWLCSGQSNMLFEVREARDAGKEIPAASYPKIRLFSVGLNPASQPQDDCDIMSKGPGSERFNKWVECSPRNVGSFSAVAYYFGRELHKELNVPIGLVHASWGSTSAEVWTPLEVLNSDSDFAPILDRSNDYSRKFKEEALPKYEKELAAWQKAADAAKEAGKPEPKRPRAPTAPDKHPKLPVVLYNGMIHPLIPYGIRGVIWYQGESNADRAYQYRKLLPAMIKSWRGHWGQGDFPFGMVQLANYDRQNTEPGDSDWAELREAQTVIAKSVPNCGLVSAIDIGDATTIHPTNKQEVGRRLSLWALAKVYGKEIAFCGPTFESYTTEGGSIRIKFSNVGKGLAVSGSTLDGFQIAGEDKKFVWASARVDGDNVIVSSESVARPIAVRYAWAGNPKATLYSEAGLPAGPFRTDSWPGITIDKR